MYEITNREKGPVQLVIKSKTRPHAMVCLNIPGLGSDKNVYHLQDELMTEYVERAEKKYKKVTVRYIPDREIQKGE